MNVSDRIIRQWMDSVYISLLELTGNGVYKYDIDLLNETLDELAKDGKEIDHGQDR